MLVVIEEELWFFDFLLFEYWNFQVKVCGLCGVSLLLFELIFFGVVGMFVFDGCDMLKDLWVKYQVIWVMFDVFDEYLSDLLFGGWVLKVLFVVCIRYIIDELDMFWYFDIMMFGLDMVMGEEVDVLCNECFFIGGVLGFGKSWFMCVLMVCVVVYFDEELGGFIDGKGEEVMVWCGICKCVVIYEEIIEMIECEYVWMEDWVVQMVKLGIFKWDLKFGLCRLILIDEGYLVFQVVIDEDKWCGKVLKGDEDYDFFEGFDKFVMQKFIELFSQGCLCEIIIMWMIQNLFCLGDDWGIILGICMNFDFLFCFCVNILQNIMIVFGDGVGVELYNLLCGLCFCGYGYLNVYGLNLVWMWKVMDEMVVFFVFLDYGCGFWFWDVVLKVLRGQFDVVWIVKLLVSYIGCGIQQVMCFL